MEPSPDRVEWIVRHLTGPWHRRHPRFFLAGQVVAAAWLVFVGIMLCSMRYYWAGALLFVIAAWVVWFAYQFQRARGQGPRREVRP